MLEVIDSIAYIDDTALRLKDIRTVKVEFSVFNFTSEFSVDINSAVGKSVLVVERDYSDRYSNRSYKCRIKNSDDDYVPNNVLEFVRNEKLDGEMGFNITIGDGVNYYNTHYIKNIDGLFTVQEIISLEYYENSKASYDKIVNIRDDILKMMSKKFLVGLSSLSLN